jgi:hypothetical protein
MDLQAVGPGGGHLQGPLGVLLAAHIAQVRAVAPGRGLVRGILAGQCGDPVEVLADLEQMARGADVKPGDQGRFVGILARQDQGTACIPRRHCRRDDPGDRAQVSGQGQLAKELAARQGLGADLA